MPKRKKSIDLLLGSDHRGKELKDYIKSYEKFDTYMMHDIGTYKDTRCDYPDIVKKFNNHIDAYSHGILICGSGFGVMMSANRFKTMRAITCRTVKEVIRAREHNDINVLCLGSGYTSKHKAIQMIKAFFKTKFKGGRHKRRINKLK